MLKAFIWFAILLCTTTLILDLLLGSYALAALMVLCLASNIYWLTEIRDLD
ncbi:MAG: hypothetical protein ACXVGN_00265 [Mycobacteriaceae bacterium]